MPELKSVTTKPQPSHGREFPLGPAEIRRAVRTANLADTDGHSILIRHTNPGRSDPLGILLLQLFPGKELEVFSIPSIASDALAAEGVRVAINALSRHKAGKWNPNLSISFKAVLDMSEESVHIVRHEARLQQRKYRGDSKFSTAFKRRVTAREDSILETLGLARPPNPRMQRTRSARR